MAVARSKLNTSELSLLQFWDGRRGDRTMPERPDFAAEDLHPWIGNLHLLEPVGGGADFRYAIFTTRTLIGVDQDMTGKLVSDWDELRAGYAKRLYSTVMEHARPIYSALPERYHDDWIFYSRICLPLGRGETITHIMTMISHIEEGLEETVLPSVIEF